MKFGLTREEYITKQKAKPQTCFAWLPIKLECGSWVWLESINRAFNPYGITGVLDSWTYCRKERPV